MRRFPSPPRRNLQNRSSLLLPMLLHLLPHLLQHPPLRCLRETSSELSSLIKEAEGESLPVVVPKQEEKAKQEEEKPKPQKARGHRVGGRCVVR